MITQMGFYCLPVELIVNSVSIYNNLRFAKPVGLFQANKISDLMFESQWYESSVNELKRSLTLVLSRAQKSIVFSGYGLVWINLRTFLMVSLKENISTVIIYYF
jgi:hypothetical protein